MDNKWIFWGSLILIVSASLNISLGFPNETIKSDLLLTSLWSRIFIILAGLISLISLFFPKIGLSRDNFKLLKKNINYKWTFFSALILVILFCSVPIALKKGGSVVIAIMNLNLIIQMIFNRIFNNVVPSMISIIGSIGYMISAAILIYSNLIKK